jgi:putative colanic acid biosysnthesis UDP-glucose lipid carrier transferase
MDQRPLRRLLLEATEEPEPAAAPTALRSGEAGRRQRGFGIGLGSGMKRNHRLTGFSPVALPLVAADALLLLGTAQAAALLALGQTLGPAGCGRTLWIGILTLLLALIASGCYSLWQMDLRGGQGRIVFRGLVLGFAVFGLELVIGIAGDCARTWALPWAALALGSLPVSRLAIAGGVRTLQRRGVGVRGLVLVTAGTDHALRELLAADPGYRVRDSLDIDDLTRNWQALPERVRQCHADEVWISLPISRSHLIQEVLDALWDTPVGVLLVPEFWESRLISSAVRPLAEGGYGLMLTCTPLDEWHNRALKRIEDLVLGTLIGLLILPVCGLIALAVRAGSPGPVLFRQRRHGLAGDTIEVYKFRTMYIDQPEPDQVHQACRDDPRVTPIGRFLRRTSLDELPQFLNVLQGRMSIVGPRPHALEHNEYYKYRVESYMWRHRVKPGITGWAQVNGWRGETDTLDKMEKRVEHDLWYIDHWSLWLDLKIIVLTLFRVLRDRNAY